MASYVWTKSLFSSYVSAHNTLFIWMLYSIIGVYSLFLVSFVVYFVVRKQYKKLFMFIIGLLCTMVFIVIESVLIFAIGLSGGATG